VTKKKKRNWAIIISVIGILIASVALIINYASFTNNNAPPKIEIGQYQSEPYLMVSNSVTVTVTAENQTTTTTTINKVVNGTQGYNLYNITYEVRNTGKQTAHNIIVTGWAEPSSNCSIISTYVYVGNPLPSNLLRTVDKSYSISLLGAGESYVFRFEMKDNNLLGQSIFHIDVTSDDAGSQSKQFVFNY
jgi:hypothetical protein